MNLKFKSTSADLKFNIQTNIRILNQNMLYCSKQLDWLVSEIKKMNTNKNLQNQVDEYFEETSPQTEPDNKSDLD